MSHETVMAFALFAFAASITPGPNNLMLLASGANFGFRASVPHVLGVASGFMILVASVGFGLAEIFARLPWLYAGMRGLGAAYLLYLAWRIATATPPDPSRSEPGRSRPMSFLGAVAFQWVNPKAWLMAVSAFSTYVPATSNSLALLGVVLLFGAINLPSITAWALGGSHLQRLLQTPRRAVAFNLLMAGLLVASLLPMLATAHEPSATRSETPAHAHTRGAHPPHFGAA